MYKAVPHKHSNVDHERIVRACFFIANHLIYSFNYFEKKKKKKAIKSTKDNNPDEIVKQAAGQVIHQCVCLGYNLVFCITFFE